MGSDIYLKRISRGRYLLAVAKRYTHLKKNLILLIVFLFGLVSCKTRTHDPIDIISSKNIEMTITWIGCFGSTSKLVTVFWEGSERRMTCKLLEGSIQPNLDMKFTAEKERILSELLTAAFENQDKELNSQSSCNNVVGSISIFSISTESYTCDDFHGDCKIDSLIHELLLP